MACIMYIFPGIWYFYKFQNTFLIIQKLMFLYWLHILTYQLYILLKELPRFYYLQPVVAHVCQSSIVESEEEGTNLRPARVDHLGSSTLLIVFQSVTSLKNIVYFYFLHSYTVTLSIKSLVYYSPLQKWLTMRPKPGGEERGDNTEEHIC